MAWEGSTRSARLPSDWPKRRMRVKRRAKGRCEAITHVPECDGVGTECDHVIQGDNHSISNLQWLSTPCHKAKTQADKLSRRRPPEKHPGAR